MAQRTNVSKVKSAVAPSTDFLEGLTGDGLETMTDAAVSTAYLGIVQPGSSATAEGAEPGTFRNSATGESYGNTVRVVPIAFDIAWVERLSEPPFTTVAPNVSSRRACKSWNSQLKSQMLPNGTKAPIYAHAWDLAIELVPNPQQPANKMARLAAVHKDDAFVSKELFEEVIQPSRAIASNSMLAIEAPEEEM